MTLRLPILTLSDKLLRKLRKRRAVFMPEIEKEHNSQYAYLKCKKESFIKALLRSNRTPLPEGSLDLLSLSQEDIKS